MPGYWVSPDGKINEVDIDHYEYIEKHPRKFGLKPSQVRGKQVEEIWDLSLELIKKGWMRVRDRGFHGYIFQVANAEEQIGNISIVLAEFHAGPDETVVIAPLPVESSYYRGTVEETMSGEILRRSYG